MLQHKRLYTHLITEDKLDLYIDALSELDLAYPTEDMARKFISADNTIVLVSLDGDDVVAVLIAYLVPNYDDDRPKMLIHTVEVHEDYASTPVLFGLLTVLKQLAQEHDCADMEINVTVGDKAAIESCVNADGLEEEDAQIRYSWIWVGK